MFPKKDNYFYCDNADIELIFLHQGGFYRIDLNTHNVFIVNDIMRIFTRENTEGYIFSF